MAAVAAALAGTAGIAAYLDGKYHIIQDLKVQRNKKLAAKHLADLSALLTLSVSSKHSSLSIFSHPIIHTPISQPKTYLFTEQPS